MRPALSRRQSEVFDYITERVEALGYPPTIREIGLHFGIRSTNGVADHIKALVKKGYMTHEQCKSRTLRPVELAQDQRNVKPPAAARSTSVYVPMLGRVAAGRPILAIEDARPEDSLLVDSAWLGSAGRDVFALKVAGDSMIDDGIFSGDTVFVKKRDYAANGETVVVMIDNEATLKRYFFEGGRVRLQPANTRLTPTYLSENDKKGAQVLGVVIGVFRKL